MRRRALLGLCGSALAGLAGCLGDPSNERPATSDPTTSDPTTQPPTTTTATPTPATLDLTVESLQPALIGLTSPDSIGPTRSEGQYLLLSADVTAGTPPALEEIAFHFDGRTVAPASVGGQRLWPVLDGGRSFYTAERGSGLLVFELPESGDASDARLTWPGGEWHPARTLRDRLAAPAPAFAPSVEVPESVPKNEAVSLSLTVTTEGDLPRRFVAGVNRSGPRVAYTPVEPVSLLVPPDGSKTWEHTDSYMTLEQYDGVGDDDPDMTYGFQWPGGSASRHVRLTEG